MDQAVNQFGQGLQAAQLAKAQHVSQVCGVAREPLLVDRLAEANGHTAASVVRLQAMMDRLSGPSPTSIGAGQNASNAQQPASTLVREVNRLATQQGDLETVISRLEALI